MAAGDYNPVNKRIVYVGGLSEEVDQKVVQGAFLPFGDIVDIRYRWTMKLKNTEDFVSLSLKTPRTPLLR